MYSGKNLLELVKLIGKMDGNHLHEDRYFTSVKAVHSVWPNKLMDFHVPEGDIQEVLNELELKFKSKELPITITLNKDLDNTSLINEFKRRNYRSGFWTAMSYPLEKALPESISDLQIRKLTQTDELKLWLQIAEEELMGGALDHQIFEQLLKNKQCLFLMGFLENEPVATSLLYSVDGSAGLYIVATRESFRNRGFGKHITVSALQEAKSAGNEIVHLQATKAGKGVYESIGFEFQGEIPVFQFTG